MVVALLKSRNCVTSWNLSRPESAGLIFKILLKNQRPINSPFSCHSWPLLQWPLRKWQLSRLAAAMKPSKFTLLHAWVEWLQPNCLCFNDLLPENSYEVEGIHFWKRCWYIFYWPYKLMRIAANSKSQMLKSTCY